MCLSEPLMRRKSSAILRFAWRSCSTSLTPCCSIGGFVMCCGSELNKSVLSGSPCLDPRLCFRGCFWRLRGLSLAVRRTTSRASVRVAPHCSRRALLCQTPALSQRLRPEASGATRWLCVQAAEMCTTGPSCSSLI